MNPTVVYKTVEPRKMAQSAVSLQKSAEIFQFFLPDVSKAPEKEIEERSNEVPKNLRATYDIDITAAITASTKGVGKQEGRNKARIKVTLARDVL